MATKKKETQEVVIPEEIKSLQEFVKDVHDIAKTSDENTSNLIDQFLITYIEAKMINYICKKFGFEFYEVEKLFSDNENNIITN